MAEYLTERLITAEAGTVAASGDTTLHTPAGEKWCRLHYFSLSADGANAGDLTVTLKFGSSAKYKVSLKAGAIFARNISAGEKFVSGGAASPLILSVSGSGSVHWSIEYEDV